MLEPGCFFVEKIFFVPVIEIILFVLLSMTMDAILGFDLFENYTYEIIRKHKEKEEIISSPINKSQALIKFEDLTTKNNEIYEYYIRFTDISSKETFESNHITLKSF